MARPDHARAGLTVRCAIYTRKSSDEGLEQEFNSLDAQREACEAYIVSQRHAGWVALADMYDDGGLSGGTMERPALKRLLEDIEAGSDRRCLYPDSLKSRKKFLAVSEWTDSVSSMIRSGFLSEEDREARLWEPRLSISTISPGDKVGTSICST